MNNASKCFMGIQTMAGLRAMAIQRDHEIQDRLDQLEEYKNYLSHWDGDADLFEVPGRGKYSADNILNIIDELEFEVDEIEQAKRRISAFG